MNVDIILGSGSPEDRFTGMNAPAVFDLDGNVQYTGGGKTLLVTGFENIYGGNEEDVFNIHGNITYDLFGGAGDDTFSFDDNATLTGTIDGQSGNNTLDYSDYTTSRNIYLTDLGSAAGFNGSEESITGTFINISGMIGGIETDVLSGINRPGVWTISSTGGTYVSMGRSLTFSGVESFSGSGFDDRFIIKNDANLTGSIDGRSGNDTIDFSDASASIIATLMNGYMNVFKGGVTSIENIIGGSGNDNLTGDERNNILDGGSGNDFLAGLDGNDSLISGTGNNVLDGGNGDDLFWSGIGFNTLYGGLGLDTAYIDFGGGFIVPLNDIEFFFFLKHDTIEAGFGEDSDYLLKLRLSRVLLIPVESGQKVVLTAPGYDAIILRLPEGNQVYFGTLNGETASLTTFEAGNLPATLPDNYRFVYGMTIDMYLNDQPDTRTKDDMMISFVVPDGVDPNMLAILFWNPETNRWVEVPFYYLPASKPGEQDRLYARAERTGKYVLVIKGMETNILVSVNKIAMQPLISDAIQMNYAGNSEIAAFTKAVWYRSFSSSGKMEMTSSILSFEGQYTGKREFYRDRNTVVFTRKQV